MSISTLSTAADILNRVAAEVGIAPVDAPFSSEDPVFVQLRYLLRTAGEELLQAYPWELLVKSHQITTQLGDPGAYSLPGDFGYLINQTGWERSNNVPLGGPLSAQEWTYLEGRDLAQNTIYPNFRIAQGKFNIYPSPVPVGLDINFEYVSSFWVTNDDLPLEYQNDVLLGSDVPLYDKTLITRAVKVKYLEASGFDTAKAQADYNQIFSFLTGNEKGAPKLNAGGARGNFPYLSVSNLPDTGYGL